MSAAAPSPSAVPVRKSFAQVAAAAHKPVVSQPKAPAPTDAADQTSKPQSEHPNSADNVKQDKQEIAVEDAPVVAKSQDVTPADDTSRLNVMMKSSNLDEQTSNSLDFVARKEHSDTKSVASRTTFTLDEKESLRPDDSASMQAGGGDDDSPSESLITGAKVNSSSDARAFRDQLYEIDRTGMAQRHAGQAAVAPARNGGIVYPPQSGAPAPAQVEVQQPTAAAGPPPGLVIPPDDKLQEALASPKDRLFVLKVEQDLIDFIKDSKDHELQLPQTNAFYRMLCHKLAEYYFLGHIVDDSLSAVRIFRLPHSRLPPPLIKSETKPESGTPPPPSSARKIMRRGANDPALLTRDSDADGSSGRPDTGNNSGSDDDKDNPNKMKDKSQLTREEREKQYNEVRARIFEGFEGKNESESANGQDSKGISRTSSASGQRKSKKKRPKDDSFEARSAYSQFNGQSIMSPGFYQGNGQAQGQAGYYPMMAGYAGFPGSPPQYQQQSPGFGMPNAGQQDYNAGQWQQQQFSGQYDANSMPQYSPAHYDPNSGGFQPYSAGNIQSESTPKPQQPALAGYYQGYQQQSNGMPWMQQGFNSGYAPQNMYGGGDGRQYAMQYGAQGYQHQQDFQQHGFAGQAFNPYQGGQFDPNSQAFIPRTHSGQWQQMPMQAQHPHSGFTSPPFSNASPNVSATRSNQSHSQNSKKSSATSGNIDSITKWATPANLPAKPPPLNPTNFQTSKFKETPQSLPNNPFTGNKPTNNNKPQ